MQADRNDVTTLLQADPTIFVYQKNYYLYGTNEGNADSGFKVFTSTDLTNWHTTQKWVLEKGKSVFGTKGFWAPQVFTYHNKFYIAYTANEHIAIANRNSLTGLFTQRTSAPLDSFSKQIDPFVFFDTDGNIYLYHVRLQNGNRIFVEKLNDTLGVVHNTLQECISADVNPQPWENTKEAGWTVTEGPTVIKHQNLYYLFYSANDFRNPDYAVGYATSKSPYGPWEKYNHNPIISRQLLHINGTGHGDIIKDRKGDYFYVFHTHNSSDKVGPRKTAIVKINFQNDGSVSADTSTFRYLTIPKS